MENEHLESETERKERETEQRNSNENASGTQQGSSRKQPVKKTHRLRKVLLIILASLLLIGIAVLLFLRLWPAFGGTADAEDRAEYERRAENYEDGKFIQPEEFSIWTDFEDPYAERTSGKGIVPEDSLPIETPQLLESPSPDDVTITWFGHSTTLLQLQGMNILFDPVFSDIASPVSFAGSRRFSKLAMSAEELPHIDIVVFSHDHYDHLDYPTIRAIDDKVDYYIVPLGVENHLERWGVESEKIVRMAWWEETEINGLTIACTPSRHYSGRSLTDRGATLWASWVLKNDKVQIFESGDSGYGEHFAEIARRYGAFDLVMLDCAQFNGAWHNVHMFPEESVTAAVTLEARIVLPIHWAAFALSHHSWDDPAERVTQYGEEQGLTVVTPRLGETMNWESIEEYQDRWWREYQ